MVTGGLFWMINEYGNQSNMKTVFPKEYDEAKLHSKDYYYLFAMLKEEKGPKEVLVMFLPDREQFSKALGFHGTDSEIDQRLNRSIKVILEQRGLDSS